MFNFLSLHTRDWGIWHRMDIEDLSKNILVIVGPNNAGKTSTADALLTLLGKESLFGDRTVAFYVRDPSGGKRKRVALVMAHVTNHPGPRNRRPFYDAGIKTDQATIAVAVELKEGQAQRTFFIGPGRLNVQEMLVLYSGKRDKGDTGEWMGLRDWQKRVMGPAQAGPKQLDQLAIDAEEVTNLIGRRDHSLYETISKKLFDTEVLTNYDDSLRNLADAKRAAIDAQETLRQQKHELSMLSGKKQLLQDWISSDAEQAEADKVLVAAQYAAAYNDKNAKDLALKSLNKTFGDANDALRTINEKLQRADTDEKRFRIAKEEAEGLAQQASAAHDTSTTEFKEASKADLRRQNALEDLKDATPVSVDEADQAYEKALNQFEAASRRAADAGRTRSEATTRLAQLESGNLPLPDEVQATHAALGKAKIPFVPLVDVLDADLSNGPYLEAALGNLRFTIAVGEKHQAKAHELARACQFPGPIYVGTVASKDGSVSKTAFATGTPAPVADLLKQLQVKADAATTPYGTFVTPLASKDLVLVRKAIKKLVDIARKDAKLAATHDEAMQAEMKARRTELDEANSLRDRAKKTLAARQTLEDCKDADKRLKATEKKFGATLKAKTDAETEVASATRELGALGNQRKELGKQLVTATTELNDSKEAAEKGSANHEEAEAELAKWDSQVDSLLKVKIKSEAGAYTSVTTAEKNAGRVRTARSRLAPRPDGAVADLFDRQEATVKRTTESLTERETARQSAEKQTGEKRTHYLMASNDLFRAYETRLREMGELADMTILAECPKFTMQTTDEDIRNATIEVKIGYGRATPKWHGDSSFSQGQKYLNSLIIVLGLAETGQEGFFIMDEPTQNLSPDRVQVLFNFMRSTKAQYILAIPTSLDPATYKGVGHLVALTRADETTGYAPAPAIIEV